MEPQKQNYAIPVAIVIAGLLIAGAVMWGRAATAPTPEQSRKEKLASINRLIQNVPIATSTDHLLGNPAAPVVVIEYSDIECPFCRSFHPTMQQIMTEYGTRGEVAWGYRQFPLDIHPKAYPASLAAECVANLYDSTNFWKFINALMETKIGSNEYPTGVISDTLSAEERVAEASKKLSLDTTKISACVSAETYKQKLVDLRAEGIKAGLGQNDTGTPYSIIIAGQNRYFIDGAQPYEAVKALIDKALTQ